MNQLMNDLQSYYNEIMYLCKKNAYNLVLHKHLGDVFYAIASKPFFESKYKAPLHFIVRPQHEFLMKMFGVKNYSVFDMSSIEKSAYETFFNYMPPAPHKSHHFDMICKDLFCSFPVKQFPFVVDGDINNFGLFNNYWCLLWPTNMGLGQQIKFLLPTHNLELSKTAKKKIEKIAPLDKIVLFAPEAATFPEFGPEFWNVIADAVHTNGYKIIVNSKKFKINHGVSAFDLGLSLQDVVALGLNCANVFSLRSGLCDVLVGCGKRLFAFYPSQGRRELYSLTKPFAKDTGVNEIQVWDWKIDKVIWNGIDLTNDLQKIINQLHKTYYKQSLWHILSFGHRKTGHFFWRNLMRDIAGISRIFPDNNLQNPRLKKYINLSPFYSKNACVYPWATETKCSILGGLVTFKKDTHGAQKLRLCGIPVYSKKNQNKFRKSRLFGVVFHKKDLQKNLLEKIIQNIDDKYDDIYICRHNIGETYVYLTHLKNWIGKNGSKRPLLLVWREKDVPLYKMFVNQSIDIQYINISQQELHTVFTDDFIEYSGRRFFCPTPEILQNIIKKRSTIPGWNFYAHICQDFAMDGSNAITKPVVPHSVRDSVFTKIKVFFKRPFVILIPNANSLKNIPAEFWNKIISELDARGYDVFVNTHRAINDNSGDLNMGTAVTFDCDLAELYELATHASGIISLASGLTVLLTATGGKMDLIYTDTHQIETESVSSNLMLSTYSVYNLPGINSENIKEYDANMFSVEDLADLILARY